MNVTAVVTPTTATAPVSVVAVSAEKEEERLTVSSSNSSNRVRFQPTNTLKLIPSIKDYEPNDVLKIWGESKSIEDYKRKQIVKKELRSFLLGRQNSDNKNFTSIGLRDKYGSRQEDKIKIKDNAWDAVLFEQYLQRHNQQIEQFCQYNPLLKNKDPATTAEVDDKNQSMIAAVYRNISKQAQHVAQEEAKELEQELYYIRMEEEDKEAEVAANSPTQSPSPSSSSSSPSPRGRTQRKETSTKRPTFDVQAWINGRKKVIAVADEQKQEVSSYEVPPYSS